MLKDLVGSIPRAKKKKRSTPGNHSRPIKGRFRETSSFSEEDVLTQKSNQTVVPSVERGRWGLRFRVEGVGFKVQGLRHAGGDKAIGLRD